MIPIKFLIFSGKIVYFYVIRDVESALYAASIVCTIHTVHIYRFDLTSFTEMRVSITFTGMRL